MPVLLAEVTLAQEAAVTTEATRVMAVLAAKTFAYEATAVRDNTALHVKDAEDRATLVVREALERVSRVEAESAVVLAYIREDAKGFVLKIALLEGEIVVEHRAREVSERECQGQFVELVLLQTRGSELCHAIISPPWKRHHLSQGMRHAALRHIEMAGELAALRRWCLLPQSRRLGTQPVTPSVWRFWVSWSLNSRS
jgi:hypothetical protein